MRAEFLALTVPPVLALLAGGCYALTLGALGLGWSCVVLGLLVGAGVARQALLNWALGPYRRDEVSDARHEAVLWWLRSE
jgi:hypothetical protein